MGNSKTENRYRLFLLLYTGFLIISCLQLPYAVNYQDASGEPLPATTIVIWDYLIKVYIFYAVLCISAFIIRLRKPSFMKTATKAVNILLLFNVPAGTVLGIYGLLKVDKESADFQTGKV
jgi:hypothetical protein